ncbi:hypothetical protein JT096_03165 [Helicobacter pylori]|nr:hypothetical protein [Helicobacter pylori]
MRISFLAIILALLFVACHETKKQILQNEADSTPSEKNIWHPRTKKKNVKKHKNVFYKKKNIN